ncbi:MAG TPA: amidohydrolase family protein [Steroidobacteraceae bacterium]|nr:amidohydrolase family protein [Steroidobacteraceae bacterium]
MLLHSCSTHTRSPAADAEQPGRAGRVVRGSGRTLTVDLHCHSFVPEVEQLVKGRPEKLAEPAVQRRVMGGPSVDYNNRTMLPNAFPKLTSVELRLKDMDEMGVDVQVLSPTSVQHYYWADLDLAREIVRTTNEKMAEACALHPGRLLALGNVALQHPDLSVEQLEHCTRKLGMRGVEISTAVNGLELDDPRFAKFWARAEELGCVVFIHPFGTSLGERVNRFYLQNIVGQPLETTLALSHLIFGGVLDRHPGLKILAAHGGGYLPAYIGRSDHGYRARPDAHTMKKAPSEYLRQIHFDTLVYTPAGLRHLIGQVGIGQVVLGTDYPFDMGSYDVHGLVAALGLSEPDQAALLGGNAARLIGLDT